MLSSAHIPGKCRRLAHGQASPSSLKLCLWLPRAWLQARLCPNTSAENEPEAQDPTAIKHGRILLASCHKIHASHIPLRGDLLVQTAALHLLESQLLMYLRWGMTKHLKNQCSRSTTAKRASHACGCQSTPEGLDLSDNACQEALVQWSLEMACLRQRGTCPGNDPSAPEQ